jgi:hypothetical protein
MVLPSCEITGTAGADAVTPVEEFSKQVEEFKKSYP